MKKIYNAPVVEIISIEIEDAVLVDSGLKNGMNYEQGNGMGDLDLFKNM